MGVVEHLRDAHEVEVLTSTVGGGGEPEAGIHRVLPMATVGLTVVACSRRCTRAAAAAKTRPLIARFRPELVYVFNGAGMPAYGAATARA